MLEGPYPYRGGMERNLQRVRNKGQEDCARPFTSPDDLQLSTGSERGHDVHGSLEFERETRIYEVQNVSTRRGDRVRPCRFRFSRDCSLVTLVKRLP